MKADRNAVLIISLVLFLMVLVVLVDLTPTGKVARSTVNISQSVLSNCTVIVATGYNLVSWPCITTQEDRADVITDESSLVAMYRYVPGASDPWRVHNPNLPAYVVSDLGTLSRKDGYVMLMSAPDAFPFEGYRVAFTSIGVVPGWNLVGYPSNLTQSATLSFSTINGTLVQARTYANGAGISYPGTLNQTEPGRGYWLNLSAADIWGVTS